MVARVIMQLRTIYENAHSWSSVYQCALPQYLYSLLQSLTAYLLAVTPVSEWVIDSFRFGDSYRISELCALVLGIQGLVSDKSCLTNVSFSMKTEMVLLKNV